MTMDEPRTRTVHLLQISDTHCYADDDTPLEWTKAPIYPNKTVQRIRNVLAAEAAAFDAMIISGDLAQEETVHTYRRINQLFRQFPLPVYTLPGNHDKPAMMRECLQKPLQVAHQAYFNGWRCLFIDTNEPKRPEGHMSDQQFRQLHSHLQTLRTDEFAVIFMHHHPIDIGSAWMDVMGLQQRDRFWALLSDYPQVKAVFCGHIHQEFSGEYQYPNGRSVAVWGTPSTCVQLKPQREQLEFDHMCPAWREISLLQDGRIATRVQYLPT